MNTAGDCIFCKIVAGEIPSHTVLEDDVSLAFIDIGPVARGHTLLIPKYHVEIIDELSPDMAGGLLSNLPRLVHAVRGALSCEGVNVLQNNGRIAGQLVPHVHFHIIPRNTADRFSYTWPAGEYQEGEMERIAGDIIARLSESA